ncbi:PTS alpha-glucoside transporter subunit IIBC [Erysipelotrichaceae bacterium MTC7]|nr:PTS alpha-glucoside transporter subunit IIBC [Erysipelotrichaceae bacterium MTC7]
MMQKIQRFGGAMFTPVLLFAFAGICIGVGTLFTTEAIMGAMAKPTHFWYQCWNIILQGGWTVFNQLPLLFAVSLPIGLAKKQNARACMESLVLFLTFHYFLSTILAQWGGNFGVDFSQDVGGTSGLTLIANIKTLDMGMIGALMISGISIYIHNRFYDTKLPEWLGTFSGSTFVVMIGFFVMIPVAILSAFVWPLVQGGMTAFQGFIVTTGNVGVWVFIFLERLLIPFGLHHLLYSPFFYDNAVVTGGLYSAWANMLPTLAASSDSLKSLAPEFGFTLTGLSKMFGCPGIALAFYATAKSEKKKRVLGLLVPITLTAVMCGVTEPIEFTFLFIAPGLYVVHCILAATLATVSYMAGVVGIFAGGAIECAALNWIPLMSSHWMTYLIQFVIGIAFTGIYFVVFRTLILKFNFATPGREIEEDEDVKFYSKKEFREKNANGGITNKDLAYAQMILDGLGGAENIEDVTNCATRLRVNVKDETIVKNDKYFKEIGAHGLSANGKSMQVIVGLSVARVRDDFEQLLTV